MQDVGAENAISLCVGDELDHSFDVIGAKRPTVGSEWKFANADIDPPLFRLIFGETNTRQLGIGVDDTGNSFVVYVAGFAGNDFYAGDSFVLGFVRQHRPSYYIADRVNPFHVRAKMFVHFDPLLFVELHANFFRAQTIPERTASD